MSDFEMNEVVYPLQIGLTIDSAAVGIDDRLCSGISIDRGLNRSSSLKIRLHERACAWRPRTFTEIELTSNSVVKFAGLILDIEETLEPDGSMSNSLWYELDCADWRFLLDKTLVTASWTDTSASTMVSDIISRYLSTKNVTGSIQEELPVLGGEWKWEQVPATTVLTEIAAACGAQYYIRYDKLLVFRSAWESEAAISLSDTSGDWRNLRVRRSMRDYANTQVVKSTQPLEIIRRDSFIGNGGQTQFPTTFLIDTTQTPTITVDGTPVGGWTTETWYVQAPSPPDDGAVIQVLYVSTGAFGAVATKDQDEIDARGQWDSVYHATDATKDGAQATADERLSGAAGEALSVEFDCYDKQIEPGEWFNSTVTRPLAPGPFTVESVSEAIEGWMQWRVHVTGSRLVDTNDDDRPRLSSTWDRGVGTASAASPASTYRPPTKWGALAASWTQTGRRSTAEARPDMPGITWSVGGTFSNGVDVAAPVRARSDGILSFIRADAGTAPSGADFEAQVNINGEAVGSVVIPDGETQATTWLFESGSPATSVSRISRDDLVTLDIVNDGGAADVSVDFSWIR